MLDQPPFGSKPDLPYIDFGGHRRYLAALPNQPGKVYAPSFRIVSAVIPRSEWQELDYSGFYAPILDQNGYNACAGHAGATTFTREWSKSGRTQHPFSAWYLYTQVCGGFDGGANLGDCIQSMTSIGMVDDSQVPHGVYRKGQIPAGCDDTAKRFRLRQAYELNSFDDLGTALMLGYTLYFGINVGQRFGNLDTGGVPGVGGWGGHALHGCGLVKVLSGSYQGRWAIRTQNSWSTAYGQQGFCNLVEEHFHGSAFGAYAVKGLNDDPQDSTNPPVLV